jgi:RNA polymerase sigma-70 factor (sigma-E family)
MSLLPARRDLSAGSTSQIDLEGLFRAEWTRLVRVAFLLVDDLGLAEDLVQEAFVRTHQAQARIRDADAAPAYLRATTVNLARSRLRRLRLVRRHPPRSDVAAASPEEQVVLSEDHHEVLRALRRLPQRQRECVVLRYYLDLSEKEIATALGISAGSVKSHSHRAITALTTALEALR